MKITLQQLFDLAIQKWIQNDIRWEKKVKEYLKELNKKYKKLEKSKKEFFDINFLTNPYPDSKIHFWDKNKIIKKIIVWVDIEWPEILLVNEYNKNNLKSPIDLIVWHHPEWKALIDLDKIMQSILPQADNNFWVPINQAEKINEPRVWKVFRSIQWANSERPISFAKILNIPFFGIHTPADNMCYTFIDNEIKKQNKKIKKLQDIIDILEKIPEMKESKKNWAWPQIWAWEKENSPGKIVCAGLTGWTSGSKDIYKQYAISWVWTILMMHISEDHLELAKKHNLNVIITDHMASDSLWMNLILDEYKKLWIEILDFSGIIRVSRI